MIQTIAFYLFAALVIASAVMVIMSRNPVHSVLWLILAFFKNLDNIRITFEKFSLKKKQ